MRVAVVGASGYVGLELLRILLRHPEAEIVAATSEQRAGQPVAEGFPSLRGLLDLRFEAVDPESLARRAEFVFTSMPHGTAAPVVAALHKAGVAVADLADFRLHDPETYASWYGVRHTAPELLREAVYGLPELHREALRGARIAAMPGCYPTSALLPLLPFLRSGRVDTASIVIDAKSGVSGAGRNVSEGFLFAELDENASAYKVGGVHRHVPEIEQEASAVAGAEVRVTLVPHLLPSIRGIVTSVYLRSHAPFAEAEARRLLEQAYADEPFVRVLPEGTTPRLSSVRGSNFCDLAAFVDARAGNLVLLSALDNLVKGAGGQGVQCMNLMCGFPETTGLLEAPLVP